MTITSKAASVLGYRVLPTSIVALLSYAAVFFALLFTNSLSSVPTPVKQRGLDLEQAYKDLHHIAANPHPYISHANDNVREYILSRVLSLAEKYPHIHVDNDLSSNASWSASPKFGVYFEGMNVLVKVDGTAGSSEGAVLFSAHFDSVSTATGATDDGAGVVTLLQLVEYFAKHRAKRTAIFNINNGEEDGLHGAHAFLEHPWSKETDTFLNLEGAAAGGRPILFRATSMTPVRAFRNMKLIPHPHANVLSSDAFARGIIRSWTDFSIYSGPGPTAGMKGLDLAFYKGRSRYHSKYDSVQHTVGGIKSLWSMLEVARGVAVGLLNVPFDDKLKAEAANIDDDPVIFSVFKRVIVVFHLTSLLTFNIAILIAGPLVLVLLLFFEKFFLSGQAKPVSRRSADTTAEPAPNTNGDRTSRIGNSRLRFLAARAAASRPLVQNDDDQSDVGDVRSPVQLRPKSGGVIHTIWSHVKFWFAFVLAAGLLVLLTWGYTVVNPFAIYSSPYLVLFAFMTLTYLVLIFVLTFPSSLLFYHPKPYPNPSHFLLKPAQQQKHTIFIHLYTFTWILLVLGTLGITKLNPGLGGGYLLTAWNFCVGSGVVMGVVEGLVTSAAWKGHEEVEQLPGEERDTSTRAGDADDDESTPLLWRGQEGEDENEGTMGRSNNAASQRQRVRKRASKREEEGGAGTLASWWWIPQFLVSVPLPVILWGHVTMLLLDAVPQTMTDGASPWSVYALVLMLALILVLPLAPFAYKLRPSRLLTYLVLTIFISSTLYTMLAFPFSVDAPLKVFFQQRVEFPSRALYDTLNPELRPRVVTAISGPPKYIVKSIIASLPSAQGKDVFCRGEESKLGLLSCEWEVEPRMWPSPGTYIPPVSSTASEKENVVDVDLDTAKWDVGQLFKASVKRNGPSTALVSVTGRNTRSCRVYFDSGPAFEYNVWPASSAPRATVGADQNTKQQKRTDQAAFTAPPKTHLQEGYQIGPAGIKELRLWSRTWERQFKVEVDWKNETDIGTPGMHGRIACVWSQYESGMVDNGALYDPATDNLGIGTLAARARLMREEDRPKIPAFEEVLAFLPEWATVSKLTDGLVEATVPFSV
ncbi:Vacuolar membrane protease [Psilocybe cubensis]|uniref:Vacuolar membrane protease n=2 Tax=Psilocybe cubensis TaxID=181762 RepID=A0ACB8HF95_PSICU|nr:Vacuolar membrane protease [Psilocybe cubensis]KAH9485854.1 Vacuolar membrane protease [Psilocybe cubensis]